MTVPDQSIDTRPEAEAMLIKLIREQSPTRRLAGAVAASNRVAQQCKNAISRANPGISEVEVGLRFIELNYGHKLANEVREYLAVQ